MDDEASANDPARPRRPQRPADAEPADTPAEPLFDCFTLVLREIEARDEAEALFERLRRPAPR